MKFKYLLIMFLVSIILPTGVFAEGDVSISNSRLNITKGGKTSFVITANNSAGRIDITSSNSNIVSVSESSVFLDMGSSTITVNGNSVGITTITVYLYDVTTYDDEDISGKSYTINVNVTEPVIVTPKSDNNTLKSLTVEGYDLEKINDNEYNLSVRNDVSSVNIITELEDEKASVSGDGTKELNVGDNLIEVIVTSESGNENKYIIKINRKDGYYLEDVSSLIKDQNDINVKIKDDSVVSSDILKQIKDGKKKLTLYYNDDNDKMVYSWLIDGNKLNETNDFLTSVSYISEYKKDIEKLTNYADGLYINIKNNNKLPDGTKLKLHVSDKFENGKKVKLYCYNKSDNNLKFITNEINVKSQYIEFDVNDCSNYFVTMSNIRGISNGSKSFNIFIIISIILAIICIVLLLLLKRKHKKTNDIDIQNTDNDINKIDENIDDIINVNNSFDSINADSEFITPSTFTDNGIKEENVISPISDIDRYNSNIDSNYTNNSNKESLTSDIFTNNATSCEKVIPSVTDNYLDTTNINTSFEVTKIALSRINS